MRENYTYNSLRTIQDLDSNGQVTKTETEEFEEFFVHGHLIGRMVKKDGQPLSEHEQKKDTERVTKLAEKAEKTPREQPLEGQTISVSRLLEIMEVRNPRREIYHGRRPSFLISSAAKMPKPTASSRTLQKNCKALYGSMRPTARWSILK